VPGSDGDSPLTPKNNEMHLPTQQSKWEEQEAAGLRLGRSVAGGGKAVHRASAVVADFEAPAGRCVHRLWGYIRHRAVIEYRHFCDARTPLAATRRMTGQVG